MGAIFALYKYDGVTLEFRGVILWGLLYLR